MIMSDRSDVMEELWRVKEELAAPFKTFQEFVADLMKYQSEHHPELVTR